jgi:multidrug resistance protein
VAPTIIGGFSDRYGRRPAYLFSFIIVIAANTGLALQRKYVVLIILRCIQSIGSSGTVALSSAVVSDVATRQQRGSYIGLSALGSSMGPALGPVIGGLLTHFLTWPSIFWFLAIFGGVMLVIYTCFFPETCRNIVANGSLPPQPWNKPLIDFVRPQKHSNQDIPVERTNKKRPNILSSIPIIFDKESFCVLFFGGLFYAGYYIILVGLPTQLEKAYNYNSIQVGLCFLPLGIGPLLMRPIIGRIMDTNFRRHAKKAGVELVQNRQASIDEIHIERARLEISLGMVYISSAAILPYGWTMNLEHPPLPAALVCLFIMGLCISAAFQPMTALVIDLNPEKPAAATAANNFVRCVLGAGGVAVVNKMLNTLGMGWTSTLVAGVWVVTSCLWWIVIIYGPSWRRQKRNKESIS